SYRRGRDLARRPNIDARRRRDPAGARPRRLVGRARLLYASGRAVVLARHCRRAGGPFGRMARAARVDLRASSARVVRNDYLRAEWDGHGMVATQSHGMSFEKFPATRFAWPGNWRALSDAAAPFVGSLFTAVVLGIVQTAVEAARKQLGKDPHGLRPYEQLEW